MEPTVFETHYEEYCRRIGELDFSSIKDRLGIELRGTEAVITFLGKKYLVSGAGIADASGNRPGYIDCVILSKYLLLCPEAPVEDRAWSALKDFHKMSQFTNLNVFTSDVEQPIVKHFTGRIKDLADASKTLGGEPDELASSYDLAVTFKALPRIDILLLFNDRDDEFPATCSLLYQKQAEDYLDPESLIMIGIAFTKQLNNCLPDCSNISKI